MLAESCNDSQRKRNRFGGQTAILMAQINDELRNAVASIVDTRVAKGFEERDKVLLQMHESLKEVANLLKDSVSSSNPSSKRSPRYRYLPPDKGYRTPRRVLNQEQMRNRSKYFTPKTSHGRVMLSKKTLTGKNRLGYESKSIRGDGIRILPDINKHNKMLGLVERNRHDSRRDGSGRLKINPNVPRVAKISMQDQGYTSPRDRARNVEAKWAEKESKSRAREEAAETKDEIRSTVFRPSRYKKSKLDLVPPDNGLLLDWVFGYGKSSEAAIVTSNKAYIARLGSGEIVFPAAAVVVVHDDSRLEQRFFRKHDAEVACVCVHPNGVYVASSQFSRRNPVIYIWNSGSAKAPLVSPTHAGEPVHKRPKILNKLRLDRTGGASSLDFSLDGNLLLSVSEDMNHTLVIWDWVQGERLVEGKCGPSAIYNARFNPYQMYIDDPDDPFSKRCYTIGTAGARSTKVWSLKYAENGEQQTLAEKERTPFQSSRGQWRPSFRNPNVDGSTGRVGYHARAKKMEDTPINGSKSWVLQGALCESRSSAGYRRSDELSLSMCFLNDKSGGGALVIGSSTGTIAYWHQQVEEGATKVVPRENSKRGLVDHVIMGWDPVAWQGVSIKDVHSGLAITALETMQSLGPERQVQFASAGKDNNIVIWDVYEITERPTPVLTIPIDSHGLGMLSYGRKLYICAAESGILDLIVGDESEDIAPTVILHAHRQCVEALDTHPTLPVFATCSHDKTVRLWSIKERRVLAQAKLAVQGSAIAFSGDGTLLAVGMKSGSFAVYGVQATYPPALELIFADSVTAHESKVIAKRPRQHDYHWGTRSPRHRAFGRYGGGPKTLEMNITAVKFSPDMLKLAFGCHDKNVYLYRAETANSSYRCHYVLQRICKGHSSGVTHVDFSENGRTLMSNDAAREILYWNVATGRQERDAYNLRDEKWNTWTCVLGWPVQGAWQTRKKTGTTRDSGESTKASFMLNHYRKNDEWLLDLKSKDGQLPYQQNSMTLMADVSRLHDCNRSKSHQLLVTGDDSYGVNLFRFPAVKSAKARTYRGHASSVRSVRFSANDTHVVSVGGMDNTILVWRVVDPTSGMRRRRKRKTKNQQHGVSSFSGRNEDIGESEESVKEAWDYLSGKKDRYTTRAQSRQQKERALEAARKALGSDIVAIEQPPADNTASNWALLEGAGPSQEEIDRNKKSVEQEIADLWQILNDESDSMLDKDGNVVGSISPRKPGDANKAKGNWREKRSKRLYEETKKAADSFPSGKDDHTAAAQENNQASATKKAGPPKKEEPPKKAEPPKPAEEKAKTSTTLEAQPHATEEKVDTELAETEAAAIKIQAAMRGKRARKTFKSHLSEKGKPSKESIQEKADEADENNPVICSAFADFDYEANGDDELSLKEGDEIKVTEIDDDDGWWHGKLDGKYGAFPYNYVHLKVCHGGKEYMVTTEEKELYEIDQSGESNMIGTYDRDTKTFTDLEGKQEVWDDAKLL